MAAESIPHLCGGIFFALVLEARRARRKARAKLDGGTDNLTAVDVYAGLTKVLTGEDVSAAGKTISKACTLYKTCQSSSGTYVPFTDRATISAFDASMKRKNPDLPKRMSEFIDTFLNLEKCEWLVRALIDTIQQDSGIDDGEGFLVTYEAAVRKQDLDKVPGVILEPFLLSVLHFILLTSPDAESGRPTFEAWYSQSSKKAEWVFRSDVGAALPPMRVKSELPADKDDEDEENDNPLDYTPGKSPVIFGTDGVAPDLAYLKNGSIFLIDSDLLADEDHETDDDEGETDFSIFATYLEKATQFQSNVKTLLYSEKPRHFYDIYVCNEIVLKQQKIRGQKTKAPTVIQNATIEKLAEITGYIIISGTGGIGKSMMMKHLFLQGVNNIDDGRWVPILIQLKNYTTEYSSLLEFIHKCLADYDPSISLDIIREYLDQGRFAILLDGLDEIASSYRQRFEAELDAFAKTYSRNVFIMSSRPTTSFSSFTMFAVFDVWPFSKSKALELIDKLDFSDVEAKAKFREELDRSLYNSHRQFASNPLLLTIMLMTYTSFGEVPRKMHVFYAKAYETMARLHDASKGAYQRPLNTGLSPEDFAEFFAEFCARTYRDEVFEFSLLSFEDYMDKVIRHKTKANRAKWADELLDSYDFLLDVKDNLCLMYEEDDSYYFVHRSFQEYFCALFFSHQMDDTLQGMGDFFENKRNRKYGDMTFEMLYDMIPEKVERHIFPPFLKNLIEQCDAENGYWTFLDEMYPEIYNEHGSTPDCYENEATSFLYNFIIDEFDLSHTFDLDNLDWPLQVLGSIDVKEWVQVDYYSEDEDGREIVRSSIVLSDDPEVALYDGDPEVCGTSFSFEPGHIIQYPKWNEKLIAYMESEEFPLMKEYRAVREYLTQLEEQKESTVSSDDWFDRF